MRIVQRIKGGISVDKNIFGVKVSDANIEYDLTLSSLVENNMEGLKETIAKVLFK